MRPSRPIAIRVLVAVACGIASAVLGATVAAADDGPDLAAIDRYVRSEMDAQRIPGLALGIVHGDRIVHVQGFGHADRVRAAGDPGDAVPDRFGDQVVHCSGHHAAERGGPGAAGRASAALPAVVAGRRSGRVNAGSRFVICCTRSAGCRRRPATRTRPAGTLTTPPSKTGSARCVTPNSPSRLARPGSTATPTTGPWG